MSYVWWQRALKGVPQEIHESDPQPGFYRTRRSREDRTMVPVAIWATPEGELKATKDGKPVDAVSIWTYVARNPVPEDVWRMVSAGGQWPDAAPPPVVPGHNLPDDPLEAARVQLEAEAGSWTLWLATHPIENDDNANAAAEIRARIADLGKEAEESRKAEKEPFLIGGREVDAKWKPVIAGCDELVGQIKAACKPYLDAKADEDGKARIGNTGAALSLREVRVAVIDDMAAFLMSQQSHPDIVAAANKVAGAIIRAKMTAPGLSFRTETRV